MLALAIKLFGAPLLIGCASLAGKRHGPALAGLLSGLPVIVGPIIAVLWLEHGSVHASQVAWMLPVGMAPLAAYLWVFSRLARHRSWPFCLLGGWLVFLITAWICRKVTLPYPLLAGGAILTLIAVGFFLPRPRGDLPAAELPHAELLARIAAAFTLVVGLTGISGRLGTEWTGLLAAFPVAGSVIPAFTLARSGPAATLRLLRGFVSGLLGLSGFAFCLAWLLPAWNGLAFIPAMLLCVAIAWLNSNMVLRS